MGVFDSLFTKEESASTSKYEAPVAKMTAGMQTATGAPKNLDTWRFVSEFEETLDAVVELFGGKIKEFKTPKTSGKHVITTAHDIEVILDSADDIEVAAILWEGGRPQHKCNFKIFVPGTQDGTPGEPCGCASYGLRELKKRAKDGTGPGPNMSITFRLESAPELGKIRFTNGSWGLAKVIDAFKDEVAEHEGPVRAVISKAYRSFTDPDTDELVEYREILPSVIGPAPENYLDGGE